MILRENPGIMHEMLLPPDLVCTATLDLRKVIPALGKLFLNLPRYLSSALLPPTRPATLSKVLLILHITSNILGFPNMKASITH